MLYRQSVRSEYEKLILIIITIKTSRKKEDEGVGRREEEGQTDRQRDEHLRNVSTIMDGKIGSN